MAIKCIECNKCKNDRLTAEAGAEYCEEGAWDRNDEDQTWLHVDEYFVEYVNKDRMCSDYVAL